MRKTIAEAEREEARLEAKREVLFVQLGEKFGPLSPQLSATIQTCTDEAQLNAWIRAFAKAKRVADIGIQAKE